MSHVSTVELHVTSLDDLKAACKRLGLEWRENQTSYRWWGRSVGDTPLPEGFAESDLGHCQHAIGIPNDLLTHTCSYGPVAGEELRKIPGAYEIGVIRRRDGKPGYVLQADFYDGGYGLEAIAGANCSKLKQAYATEVAKRQAIKSGFRVQERKLPNGATQLVCVK